jgi:DNA repair exonuclease SbcCD ATPase subunit
VNELQDHAQAKEDQADALEALQEELAESQEKIHDLEENLGRFKEAKEDRLEALEEKEKAEANLNEVSIIPEGAFPLAYAFYDQLREEMVNKSFSTKGLSRQLEEKTHKIQDELEHLREEHAALKGSFNDKVRELRNAQESLEEIREEGEIQEQMLRNVSVRSEAPLEAAVLKYLGS